MIKKLAERKSSKSVESKNIKIVEPNSSKSSTKKNTKQILEDPFADHEIQIRDFCNLCTKPPTKKPIFNQFNLPVETTTNTASCMVKSCYISVKQIEAVVNAPVCTTKEIESLKASIKSDSSNHKKRKMKTSPKTFQDRQMEMLMLNKAKYLDSEEQMKIEEAMGFNEKSNTLEKNLDRVGPHWYQELSNKQMALMEVLECSLLTDWEEGVLTRLNRILAEMGILPRPKNEVVEKAVSKSYLSPILFLAYLYKFTTKHPLVELKYSVNDRLLLSGLAFLALPRTLMDLEWRIPIQYPKQKCVAKTFNPNIPAMVSHYAKKRHEESSPYVEPLPYFIHRKRVEEKIIEKKERRHSMINKKPPDIIQRVCPLPCLKPQSPKVSEPTETMPTDNSQTSGSVVVQVTEIETASEKSADSTSSCLKTSKTSAPKSARFKVSSNEKVNTRSSDPQAYPAAFRTEEDEEVEIQQLMHDSVCGMATERDRPTTGSIPTSPSSHERPPEEKTEEGGGLQINKKRSRQVKSETTEVSVTPVGSETTEESVAPVGSETYVKVETPVNDESLHAAPDTQDECPSQVCVASNTVFGTMEQVYSIVMTRINETTEQTTGTKAPEEATGDGTKPKKCVCAEELAAEKLEQEAAEVAAAVDKEPSQPSQMSEPEEQEASGSVQLSPETVEEQKSLQNEDQLSLSSLLPDPIPTTQAISAVLNGYWTGYCLGHDQDETEIEEKVVKRSKDINKCLQEALFVMSQEGNILASLPHSHKLPAITYWLKYRNGYKMTKAEKVRLLTHSRAHWGTQMMHPRNIRVPHMKFTTYNMDWSYKNSIVKMKEKVYLKYFSNVRQALVDDTREYWPTMRMNDFHNQYYRDVHFAYLMSKEEDCVQTRLVF